MGLGLAITYGIVRDYGGTITIDSRPGEGTTFALSFPAAEGQHGAELNAGRAHPLPAQTDGIPE
jgi:histidine kinase